MLRWVAGLAQGVDDDLQHFFFGSGFACPDFKLAGALLDEHLDACDDLDSELGPGEFADQRCVGRVVDQVEDVPGFEAALEVGGREDLRRFSGRPCRRGVALRMTSKVVFGEWPHA